MDTQYIGLDAHSSTCTFCVIDPQGAEIDNKTIVTNGRLLVDYVQSLGGKNILAFEECDLSCWLFDILHKHVREVVVCNPAQNAQYKRAKTDKLDARNLANLLRGGYLKPVFHDASAREKLRMLVSSYQDNLQEVVRIKNRLKTIKRRVRLYPKKDAPTHASFIQEQLTSHLDQLLISHKEYQQQITRCVQRFKETNILMSIPGIGYIHSAKIIAQVIDPERFKSKYKFFAYCGLVKHPRISANRNYGSTRIWGNRTLKCVFKMAAHSAIGGHNSLNVLYGHLRDKGVSDRNARNTIARKIATLTLSLWKNNQRFSNEIVLEGLPVKV